MKFLLIALVPIALFAQQRDAVVVPVGTAQLSGVVVTAGVQAQPLRRAIVSITSDQLPAPRSVITDDGGRFSFEKLPAGAYSVTAKKAAYLTAEYGSTKPGRAGAQVDIKAGEKRAVTLSMFRGAAIAGTLRNPNGTPLAGVSVMALNTRTIGRRAGMAVEEPIFTNDRGEYRMYGLMPGEYVVAALPVVGGTGEIGARPAADMDALLAAMTQRQKPSAAAPAAQRPPALQEPRVTGYAPIYFPGTPYFTDAERIRVAPGDDRNTIGFEVPRVPVATIEGIVSGDVPNIQTTIMSLVPEVMEVRIGVFTPGAVSMTYVPPNENGEFKFGNVPPGKYRIMARGQKAATDAPAPPPSAAAGGGARGRGGAAGPGGNGDFVYAVADIEVRGQDIKGVGLALQPGGSIAGRLVFESGGAPVPTDFSRVRIGVESTTAMAAYITQAMRLGDSISGEPMAGVRADGTFRIANLGPTNYTLTSALPPDLARVWKLRSAIIDGRDLLDAGFMGMNIDARDVVVTLSDKKTEINGSLVSGNGQPAVDYFVVALSTDRSYWRFGSRRLMSARPSTAGRFAFSDLPAGDYFIAAVTDLDPLEWQDAGFLEQLAPAAVRVKLAEGETRTQDLRIK